MIPPLTRRADTRPPIDASFEDGPEFDRLPPFRSRRSDAPLPDANEGANGFVSWVWPVLFGAGLLILAGFGIWLGMVVLS